MIIISYSVLLNRHAESITTIIGFINIEYVLENRDLDSFIAQFNAVAPLTDCPMGPIMNLA